MAHSTFTIHLNVSGGFDEQKGEMKMAGFFEDLGKFISEKAEVVSKKTGEVVDVVTKKTEQTVEVQKIKNQIHVMERNNERDYIDIGKIVYDKFKNGEGADADYIELCDAIAEREVEIAKAKKNIARIKGVGVCVNCGEHVESGVVFCSSCGTKVAADYKAVTEEDAKFEEEI